MSDPGTHYSLVMSGTEALETRGVTDADLPAPDVSIVVTLFNEVASVDELYRRTVATLDSGPRTFELIFVDDGSTDGTFAALERLHGGDPRVRAVRFKRNFGQHPAMHAGLSRARGDVVVTMDGDLQNQPEDIPRLVEAVEAGNDVASGRRRARKDPVGPFRTVARDQRHAPPLHGRADLGLRLRLQRVPSRRGRADARLDRQAEVHEGSDSLRRGERDRGGRRPCAASRTVSLFASSPYAHGLHVLAGFWPQPIQWIGVLLGAVSSLIALGLGIYGVVFWIDESNFPGPLFGGVAVLSVLGIQGFILALIGEYLGRIQRDVEGRPIYTIDREL